MIVKAQLYSPNHLAVNGGIPFFERMISRFEPLDKRQKSGERRLIQILRDKKLVVPFAAGGSIELTLPCDDLRKHLKANERNQLVLDMEGTISEVTPRVVANLAEDGWTPINTPRFFELFEFPSLDGEVH